MNSEDRLQTASADIRNAVAGRDPAPITRVAKQRTRMRFVAASVAVVGLTAVVGLSAVTSGGEALPPSSSPLPLVTTTTVIQDDVAGDDVVVVDLSDIAISEAVAPFDHDSNVESMLLTYGIDAMQNPRFASVEQCMVDAGFGGYRPQVTLPDRNDPILAANLQFPATDELAEVGFPKLSGIPASPDEFTPNPARDEAIQRCTTSEESPQEYSEAVDLYNKIRGDWEGVLTEIDELPDVQSKLNDFGACLVAADIPAEYTTGLGRYLGYMDSLLAELDADSPMQDTILEEYGKLYASCGRDMFETREALRSGERRTTFLSGHASEIAELTLILKNH